MQEQRSADSRTDGYVECPVTITSPAPSRGFKLTFGLGANVRCGNRCAVVTRAPLMEFRCPVGHMFYATPRDILNADSPERPH